MNSIIERMHQYNQCPWDQYVKPTVSFCESTTCAWIARPAETWSNIGFVLCGLLVIYLSRKEKHPHLTGIGVVGILVGIFSAAFHATATFWGEFLDISSMFLFVLIAVCFNLQRIFKLSLTKMWCIYWVVAILSMASVLTVHPLGIPIFFGLVTIVALTEIYIYKQNSKNNRNQANYRHFKIVVAMMCTASLVWWLDIAKIICDPDNHLFTGHSFWHLMCGGTFYFIYRFYVQFDEIKFKK